MGARRTSIREIRMSLKLDLLLPLALLTTAAAIYIALFGRLAAGL
jgi:hypothetical protein